MTKRTYLSYLKPSSGVAHVRDISSLEITGHYFPSNSDFTETAVMFIWTLVKNRAQHGANEKYGLYAGSKHSTW